MTLNGNFHEATGAGNGEWAQVSENDAGLDVYEMLANYQGYSNGGNGWLRLVRFVPGGGSSGQDRIEVWTYSPSLDEFRTDDRSRFDFDLSFADRFSGSLSGGGGGDSALAVTTEGARLPPTSASSTARAIRARGRRRAPRRSMRPGRSART
jgi:hypothetical protein